jgi:hypothetical protein
VKDLGKSLKDALIVAVPLHFSTEFQSGISGPFRNLRLNNDENWVDSSGTGFVYIDPKELENKWDKFQEIGNNIHNKKGIEREELAHEALEIVHDLRKSGYIRNSEERFRIFETLLEKIAAWLDGNATVIKYVTQMYFLYRHCSNQYDYSTFHISFSRKNNGVQTGFICTVFNGSEKTRYYIKTHQNGPTETNIKSLFPPDLKEIFVYKLLYSIGLGPEVHIMIPFPGSKMSVYFASTECPITLLSKLYLDTYNLTALIQLDLISRILCIQDSTSNPDNCGQVGDKPMIIDFRIQSQNSYVKSDILQRFYAGNGEFNYTGLMAQTIQLSQNEKLQILKQSLNDWNLLENISIVKQDVDQLISRNSSLINFINDLEKYTSDIKETVQVLMRSCE